MILYPSLEELEKKIGLRFSVVMAVAKRARQLTDGSRTFYKGDSHNPLTIATHEFSKGSVVTVPKEEGYFELPESSGTEEE
ncbi:MAG: DNA-directed RNA polymerase subunit omega [Clostridia bacterium]|nr:DNA-directed RNA polymerase subunit omega [Clostridia bacterium]